MYTEFRFRTFVTLVSVGLLLGFCAAAAPAAGQEPAPTAPPQHVTVPSLPGEANKEGVVNPTGGIQTDQYGNVQQRTGPPTTPAPRAAEPSKKEGAPARQQQGAAHAAPSASTIAGPSPSGPAVTTGEIYVTIRGVVKSFEPGKSLTMTRQKTGKDVTYTMAPGARVPAGLKPGDSVRVRARPSKKANFVDRVELLRKP